SCKQGLHHEDAGYHHGGDVATVEPGCLVVNYFPMEGRWIDVSVPALHPETVWQPFNDGRLGHECIFFGATERPGVDEGEMSEIIEVVDDQQIVRIVMQVGGNALPPGVLQVWKVHDEPGVGLRRISHPDPDKRPTLRHRITGHSQLRGNHVLARNLHAFARAVEFDAVIHTAYGIAFETTARK